MFTPVDIEQYLSDLDSVLGLLVEAQGATGDERYQLLDLTAQAWWLARHSAGLSHRFFDRNAHALELDAIEAAEIDPATYLQVAQLYQEKHLIRIRKALHALAKG
jgi:hypothetical protein